MHALSDIKRLCNAMDSISRTSGEVINDCANEMSLKSHRERTRGLERLGRCMIDSGRRGSESIQASPLAVSNPTTAAEHVLQFFNVAQYESVNGDWSTFVVFCLCPGNIN